MMPEVLSSMQDTQTEFWVPNSCRHLGSEPEDGSLGPFALQTKNNNNNK